MIDGFRDAFRLPDLKRRILFVIGALFVFRLGAHIPTPGIDPDAMEAYFAQGSGVLGFLDMFAGGALRRFSVFALGVGPYINSSIVMQLLVVIFPALEKMQKEGEEGRKKITQYTRFGTVFFALVQAIGMTTWLRSAGVFSGGTFLSVVAITAVTTGAIVVMWLGEVMSDHGIGNGTSMLIYAGIVARMPEAIIDTLKNVGYSQLNPIIVLLALVIMFFVIVGCIYLQEGQRRLPVQYAKRMVGNKVYGGQSTFIPLKINTAGVIPIIFASSVLLFPYTIASFFSGPVAGFIKNVFDPSGRLPYILVYMSLYVLFIVFFSYFYTAVVFNPNDLSNNMKKYGGFILGIRPGKPTTDYIERVMNRITLGGSVALAIIALVPTFMSRALNMTFYFGGTAVLIVVGVALDTIHQVEGQMLMRHYDGILKRRGKSGGLL
ncbi:MAG: preprotein translocase subunit SecY [Synergistaceae bacterium]|nr:preprotein translocase subunit SecY [Synergistaceae bacterium]